MASIQIPALEPQPSLSQAHHLYQKVVSWRNSFPPIIIHFMPYQKDNCRQLKPQYSGMSHGGILQELVLKWV